MNKSAFSEERTQDTSIKHLVVLICSGLLVVGCLLPWMQLGAIFVNRGIDNPDGAIVLVVAFISICVAFFNLAKKENRLRWVYILTALIGLGVGIFDLQEVHDRAQEAAKSIGELQTFFGVNGTEHIWNFVGAGLYVVLLSSIALLFVSVALFKERWYFSTSAVVIAILCVGPLALPLVWFNPKYKAVTKLVVTIAVIVLTILLCYLAVIVCVRLMEQIKELGIY